VNIEFVKNPRVKKKFGFRKPDKEDGAQVWELIKGTSSLEADSPYSYLMWCELFSETSVIAYEEGNQEKPVGFISGFIHPEKPDTLFIWQTAIDEAQRGRELVKRMLYNLLNRDCCEKIQYAETAESSSNILSGNLAIELARKFNLDYKISRYFESEHFPKRKKEENEVEWLYRVGPF